MAKRRPSGDGMVRQREDGRWEARIVIGHKKNGDPIFHHDYANTQRAITEKLHQSIERYRDVELSEDSRMTLSEWLDIWLDEYKEDTVRPSTMRNYRQYINAYIKPQLGHKQMSLITSQDIQRMYNRLKKSGRTHEHPEEGASLSDATVHHIHSMLHGAMKDAVQAHIIPRNPTEGATAPKANYKPKRILNEQELDTFMETIREDEVWYEFFYTELMTGLRRGEICALMWKDFDEKKGILNVCRTLHSKEMGMFALGATKTSKGTRTIVLPQSIVELLRQRKRRAVSQWIFPNPTSPEMPVSPGSAYHHLKILLKRAGLPDIRFHDLRHTFATLALSNGMDVKTLSAMLGHVSAATTMDIYTHITDDMQRTAAANINRGIGKAAPQEDDSAEDRESTHSQDEKPRMTDFQPYMGRKRKSGTGCISQINDHLYEGRYSPMWINGKKLSRNVYAHTREECEEKLKVLIVEMKEEIAEAKRLKTLRQGNGQLPEGTKGKRAKKEK